MHTTAPRLRRAWRPVRLVTLGAAALLTLTGCLQADLGVTLNDDESGEFRVRTVINRDQFTEIEEMFGGMAGELGGDTSVATVDPCAEMLEEDMSTDELPPGAQVEPIDDGDWCGALATIPFANLAEFESIAAEFADSADEDSAGLGVPSITKTDGGYRFEVTGVAMNDASMGLGEEGGDDMGEFADMIEQFVQDMRISYDVRLPGNPVDHNADAVDGNRFQWTLEWGDERTELFAETGAGEPDGSNDVGEIADPATGDTPADESGDAGAAPAGADADDDDGTSPLVWVALAAVVVALAVLGFVLYKRNQGPKPGQPGAPLPPPGQPSPGWQPPSDT